MSNEISFTIKLDPALRDAFAALCRSQDATASQTIRRFMRACIDAGTIPAVPPKPARNTRKPKPEPIE